jgi:hypothetical protein
MKTQHKNEQEYESSILCINKSSIQSILFNIYVVGVYLSLSLVFSHRIGVFFSGLFFLRLLLLLHFYHLIFFANSLIQKPKV